MFRATPSTPTAQQLLGVLFAFCTLRLAFLLAIAGAFLACVLFVFTLLIDALAELSFHIAQVWNASGSIERLAIFLVAIVLFNKVSPVVVRAYKQYGKVF